MSPKEEIKSELSNLVKEASALMELLPKEGVLVEFSQRYQAGYTKAIKLVSTLASDRFDEFRSYYKY